jgi:hypothetical protein
MLVFTDEATKMIWSYGLHERTSDAVLVCLKDLYDKELPHGSIIEQFHSDGGGELITERVRMYLRLKGTRNITNTPTDTPELNAISERKFRTLGEMALALLSRSGLPTVWWGKAYMAAEYITRRMPTNTAGGFMTPLEALPNGVAPSWEWLRVWGCKAYVLKPKADRRKDWDDKAQIGYFVGYSTDTVGWEIYLPDSDTFVTTVHVLFDERVPERSEDYFKELDEAAAVFTKPDGESVADFQYLVDTHHIDDEDQLLYQTKRVVERKGKIVAYRAAVTGTRILTEEKTPIHVADVVKLTEDTESKMGASRSSASATAAAALLSRSQAQSKSKSVKDTRPSSDHTDESINSELSARRGARRNLQQGTDPGAKRARSDDSKSDDSISGSTTLKNSKLGTSKSDLKQSGDTTSKNSNSEGGSAMDISRDERLSNGVPSGSSRRSRTVRHPINIGTLGEVNQMEIPHGRHVFMSEICSTVYTSRTHKLTDPPEDAVAPKEPASNKMAMSCKEWKLWVKAKNEENEALRVKRAMRLVPIRPGMKIIKSKYVFKIKKKYGKIERFKARLVALGYDEEVNPSLIFAPVVKPNTVRLLMALAQTTKMKIHQIDIANAFCCADIEGDVYMSAPDGMEIPEGMCFKLEKSLYGLKSSPRSWNKTIDKTLKSMHFMPTVSDPCLYSRWSGGKQYLVLVYVDDILIAGERVEHIQEIKDSICSKYEMTDMGELDNFLNANITRTAEKITVSQTHYCQEVMETFGFLVKGKTTKTPLPTDALEQLAAGMEETADTDPDVRSYPYRQVIGSLLYLAMYTKPEISYAVGVLSRFNDKKTAASCKLATHLLRYLNGNIECVIEFQGDTLDLHGFSDADWAGDIITRRSTTGYIIFAAGGPISWQSKLQTTVATSSMESEYMAMYAGIQELVWIRGVLKELQRPLSEPTPFLVDSKSAQDLAQNPVYHARSKHIDIKYHWLRQHTSQDTNEGFHTAILHHCSTQNMPADIFTKSLAGNLFFRHAKTITGKRVRSSKECIRESWY